jgi:cyclophilin family peptidyl-prolyl cis-trans isomerase/HEAT repeat protein
VRRTSRAALVAIAIVVSGCASAPPAPPKPPPPQIEEKLSWILRLEDQRVLRDPVPIAPAPSPPPVPEKGGKAAVVPPPLPPPPDLVRLLGDGQARTRRRAALAIGRVGLRDGVEPLLPVLNDPDAEVRQMAAFALGLIGDPRAREPLAAALDDPAPIVRGSAAEALGLIGDPASADAIARMALQIVDSGGLAQLPDDGDTERDAPASAYRLALFALVRLKAYDALASAALDASGQPRVRWWPVAFALQRLEDPRGFNALRTLANEQQPYTRAFAVKGLGPLKNRDAVPLLLPMVSGADHAVAVEAVRALERIGDPAAAPALISVVRGPKSDPGLRRDAVAALGAVGGDGASDTILDVLSDPEPPIRAAAIGALAKLDPEGFVTVLSGLDPDRHWSVRAALATALGGIAPEVALPRLRSMLKDDDQRVLPAVLAAVANIRAPDAPQLMLDHLKHDDPGIRAAAANGVGALKPPNGGAALTAAYELGQRDSTYVARGAALAAIAAYGASDATPTLTSALADKDWAIRVRAATLLKQLDPATDADARIRPAPTRYSADFYETRDVVAPPFSTQVYVETERGVIQIELAMLDAPLTVENFVTLARNRFFDGMAIHRVVPNFVVQGGDPQGDGEGGPGHSIRDELNQRPYLRGTVGMALDWPDTGGSQFFITLSPQPHLDARYTVFGRVVTGMEIVDQIQPWDVIRRVVVWDGENLQ